MGNSGTALEAITAQSEWYGKRAQSSRAIYIQMKTLQVVLAAAIPVVAVASAGEGQRWTNAALGAMIGVIEGLLQLGQYQQNWLIFRATREALKSEALLHMAGAGPYSGLPDPDTAFIVRCDALMSGEHSKWLSAQQQTWASPTTGKSAG